MPTTAKQHSLSEMGPGLMEECHVILMAGLRATIMGAHVLAHHLWDSSVTLKGPPAWGGTGHCLQVA